MKYIFLMIFLMLLTSCSYLEKHESKSHTSDIEQLEARFNDSLAVAEAALDQETGWPAVNDCDGTLWAGIACTLGLPVKIELAEYASGEIHRRPKNVCYSNDAGDLGSKSSVSKDMITGYMACLVERKDLAALKRLGDYGEKNAWIMGQPAGLVSRVHLGSNLIGILGRAIYKISNHASDREYRHTPMVYLPVFQDYERHVQVQGILLSDKVSGSVSNNMLERLKANAQELPDDQLFQSAYGRFTGDQTKALELLLKEAPCSGYARGEKPDLYCRLIWLQAAKIVLDGNPKETL